MIIPATLSVLTTSAAHPKSIDKTLNEKSVHSATNKTSNRLMNSVNAHQRKGIFVQNRHLFSTSHSAEGTNDTTAITLTPKHRAPITPTVKHTYSATPTQSPVTMETLPVSSETDFTIPTSDQPLPISNTETHTPPTHSQMTVETLDMMPTTDHTATSARTVLSTTSGSTPSTTATSTSTVTAPSGQESKQTVQVISICTTVGVLVIAVLSILLVKRFLYRSGFYETSDGPRYHELKTMQSVHI